MNLATLGWNDFFATAYTPLSDPGTLPARVAVQHKDAYELLAECGALDAVCTGRLRHEGTSGAMLPAVGDWVVVRRRPGEPIADIHAVLPRQTTFSRRRVGEAEIEQVLAANLDTVLIVVALDRDFNLRRIERYLAATWESGAEPVVVLNKSDLHLDPAAACLAVEDVAPGVPVVAISATGDLEVMTTLGPWLIPGRTVALLGSSGVGKSTLLNRILGEERQATAPLSTAVAKGRHTTTRRELVLAPGGAIIIDTPGLRELQFWDVEAPAVDRTFADIATLADQCRFRDCQHEGEPGCAVQAAREAGQLDEVRWASYQKLRREQAYAARRADPELARANQARWKKIHRAFRAQQRFEAED